MGHDDQESVQASEFTSTTIGSSQERLVTVKLKAAKESKCGSGTIESPYSDGIAVIWTDSEGRLHPAVVQKRHEAPSRHGGLVWEYVLKLKSDGRLGTVLTDEISIPATRLKDLERSAKEKPFDEANEA